MRICFITAQTDLCHLLIEQLQDDEHQCFIVDSWIDFEDSLLDDTHALDLILCDFSLLGSCDFNLFRVIKETGNCIPLIYYNDPKPTDTSRVMRWISQNEEHYKTKFPQYLKPELEKINQLIINPSIRRHISLLQPPVPVGYKDIKEHTENREVDLNSFRRRNSIPPVTFKLFKYMYEHRHREFSLKELSKVIFKNSFLHHAKEASVYSYISRLRKSLAQDRFIDIDIIRTSPGCYEMIVY